MGNRLRHAKSARTSLIFNGSWVWGPSWVILAASFR
jgi:hypothetical protein